MLAQTVISFVRHGHVHNPADVYYGRLPGFGLSDVGHKQALLAAQTFAPGTVSAVYTSPMLRTWMTAEAILAMHDGAWCRASHLLLEVHTPYDGRPSKEMEQRGWDLYTGSPPGYEQPGDVVNRVSQFIKMALSRHAGEHVVAVSHGDVIAFAALWAAGADATPESRQKLNRIGFGVDYVERGSITRISYSAPDAKAEHIVTYINHHLAMH